MNPEGKVAFVTGGAHRVGKAITLALARAGANVVINYNTSAGAAQETVKEIQNSGREGLAVQGDVADHAQVQSMVDTAVAHFGKIDILVNSASLWKKTPFPMNELDDWHRVTNILINGSFYCANAVAPGMLERGEGAIVNVIDLSAFMPFHNMIAHTVGKGGLLAMTRALALELAPNVRVNAVAPGPVMPPPDYPDSERERIAKKTLLQRWGSAEDVAEAVLYFVQADYVTGETLAVDGGERYGHRRFWTGN